MVVAAETETDRNNIVKAYRLVSRSRGGESAALVKEALACDGWNLTREGFKHARLELSSCDLAAAEVLQGSEECQVCGNAVLQVYSTVVEGHFSLTRQWRAS